MTNAYHAINTVVQRTGLSAHVIRIWEKRYGAVQPDRTPTNRRLYSDEQVERLNLLRQITHAGQSIGYVAKLPTENLRLLAGAAIEKHPVRQTSAANTSNFLQTSLNAVKSFDAHALEQTLKDAATALGTQGMLQQVVAPLAQALGGLWREGAVTAAQEHFATAILRTHLAHCARGFGGGANAPVLVVATPAGQLHEVGAMLVSAFASNLGWQVTYLGASLPAAEIAGAARQNRARAVALSLVYPDDDANLEGELLRLRDLLPPETKIIAGGRAVQAYSSTLEKCGVLCVADLNQFGSTLDGLRTLKSGEFPK